MSRFDPETAQVGSREFDYGIGDELDDLARQVRAGIAERIRRAAEDDILATPQERSIYEQAACIAEDRS